jgi:SAM-dependent methyltransferase
MSGVSESLPPWKGIEQNMLANRHHWDEVTPIHERSEFYDVAGFKAGRNTLKSIEVEEVGDVNGKSLLHLQCHFGMDTMSWARLGARVVGVDFSEEAIALARSLSAELGIDAAFICSNIYALPEVLADKFDIVFTSYGVLPWLPDVNKWAEVIAHFLKPGGTFYIVEGHPFTVVFDNESDTKELRVSYPYFHSAQPARWDADGTYADKSAMVTHPTYEWTHSLGDIINALIAAGLKIEFLHEFPFGCYAHFPFMVQGDDGWWRLKDGDGTIPLLFSLKATKEIR